MTATLKLSASLKTMLGGKDEYTVEAGKSVRATLPLHGIKPDLVAMVSVEGEMKTKDYVIREGDVVKILAVIGGG